MSQQIQGLIDKIKAEGIEAAEKRAQEIESSAKQRAQETIDQAKREVEKLKTEAKADIEKLQESSKQALKHAARDLMLSLRKEIEAVLKAIICQDVKKTLTAEALANILSSLIANFLESDISHEKVIIKLNEKDLAALNDGLISKLQKKIKEGLVFEASDDVGAGFTISFDSGKSAFDFTDVSLANQLSAYLNAQVSSLIKETVSPN